MNGSTITEINQALQRNILSGRQYEKYMPLSNCSSVSLGEGTTEFGIKKMLLWAKKYQHHTKQLAPALKGSNLEQTCKNIHHFLYWHIQYKIDEQTQQLRSPACSWSTRFYGIDCKSYTIFASTILSNLGIAHFMRRIRQPHHLEDTYTHVYVIVPKNGKNKNNGYYTIDGTIGHFGEVPYLQASDHYVDGKPQAGMGVHLVGYNRKNNAGLGTIAYTSWANGMCGTFQNAYVVGLGNAQVATKAQGEQQQKPKEIEDILYDLIVKLTGNAEILKQKFIQMKKNKAINKVKAVTTTAKVALKVAKYGGAVLPTAPISAAALELTETLVSVVELGAQIYIMFFYDPCAGAFYNASDIGPRLVHEFIGSFSLCCTSIKNAIISGTPASASIALNEMLKQTDLGVAHYDHEIKTHDGGECSRIALEAYSEFVKFVKGQVDDYFKRLTGIVKDQFNMIFQERQASTNERTWYFIVPVNHNPITAKYRTVRFAIWNENARAVLPYGLDFDFELWAGQNRKYLNDYYKDGRGNRYYTEILPFKRRILDIRMREWSSTDFLLDEEERLREYEMIPLYLKYDTDYKKSLDRKFELEVEAYNENLRAAEKELQDVISTRVEQCELPLN